jgi:hypothetical protein
MTIRRLAAILAADMVGCSQPITMPNDLRQVWSACARPCRHPRIPAMAPLVSQRPFSGSERRRRAA